MNTKRWIILGLTLVIVMVIFVGTAAYFASNVIGTTSIKAGQIVLNLIGTDQNSQSFSLAGDEYLMPGDSGKLTIGLDASGSTSDVYTTVNLIKNSVPNNFEPEITVNPEVNETIKVPQPDEKISENPNVYTQSNNMDFINLDKLSVENPVTHNEEVSTENYQETEEEPNMPELTNIIENEKVEMPNVVYENKPNDLSKVKLATAIKLAKDTVKDIKAAGYNVKVEEIDTEKDYQIIIKVEK